MEPLRIQLPQGLALQAVLRFAATLDEAPPADQYVFHCSGLDHAPPFGMLLAAACVRRFRARIRAQNPGVVCIAQGVDENDYAAHMGFWRSCGIPRGKNPGQAWGSSTHIPITELMLRDLQESSLARKRTLTEIIASKSDDVAEVLVQGKSDALESTLSYAVRELFRNVAEHSGADSIWYCAQYWPTQDRVELGVLDEGKGILASLLSNPDLQPRDEEEAVRLAVERGVSSVNEAKQTPTGMWPGYGGRRSENAGYGLYVIRELARHAGMVFIQSNDDGVHFQQQGTTAYRSAFRGTAVQLELRPNALGDLLHRLLDALEKPDAPSKITPSMLARLP